MNKLIPFCCAISLSSPSFADALETPKSPNESRLTEELVVTATRTEQTVFDALASVSIIDAADIARLQPRDLGELFELAAGTDVMRSGSLGSVTSLQTRGTNSDHTLILINGQRFNSATLGSSQFQLIDPALIERVEIVRGSRSSLYGSNAIGGVINITTKQGLGENGSVFASEIGSHNTFKSTFGTSRSVDKFRYGFSLSYLDTEGFDNLVNDDGFNEDDDGFENINSNFSLGYRFESGVDISLNHNQANAENHYDSKWSPDTQPYSKSKLRVTGLNASLPVNNTYSLNISLSQAADNYKELDQQNTATEVDHFQTLRNSAYIQNSFTWNDNISTIVGLDYYDEEIDTRTEYSERVRTNTAVFAQLEGNISWFDFAAGVRNDDNNSYGSTDTGSLALGFKLTNSHKLFASWAEGFRAPTFNDLYWPNSGNPNLLPETSENFELGLRGHYKKLHWEVAVFNNQVENLIAWAPDASGFWSPANIASAKFEGGEISAKTTIAGINIAASLSRVESTDRETGLRLPYRARHKFAMDLNQQFEQFGYGLTFKRQGDRKASFETLDSYNLLGAYIQFEPSKQLKLSARVNNVTDEDYQLNESYNQDGVNGSFRLEYQL